MNTKKSNKTKMKSQNPPRTWSAATEQKTTIKMVKMVTMETMVSEIKQDQKNHPKLS